MVTDRTLALRVEKAEALDWIDMVEALSEMPGNPYRAEMGRFGHVVALAVPGMGLRSLPNRVMLAGPGDEDDLDRALAFLQERGVAPRVDVSPYYASRELLGRLAQCGLAPAGYQVALYGAAVCSAPECVEVRLLETEEDLEWLVWMYPRVFDLHGEHWYRWMGDEARVLARRPGWRTYIARVNGHRAAAAMLHVAEGVGSLYMAGTLPEYRGRGAQTALIARRISDAAAAGCDLVVAQTEVGTVSQCNMERAGLRIAYTKVDYRGYPSC